MTFFMIRFLFKDSTLLNLSLSIDEHIVLKLSRMQSNVEGASADGLVALFPSILTKVVIVCFLRIYSKTRKFCATQLLCCSRPFPPPSRARLCSLLRKRTRHLVCERRDDDIQCIARRFMTRECTQSLFCTLS